jgi:hypothetical protein
MRFRSFGITAEGTSSPQVRCSVTHLSPISWVARKGELASQPGGRFAWSRVSIETPERSISIATRSDGRSLREGRWTKASSAAKEREEAV